MLFTTFLIAMLVLGACGNDKKETKSEDPEEKEVVEPKEVEEEEEEIVEDAVEEEKEEEEENQTAGGSHDFSELISYMEEETEGTAKVLYANDEPQVHNLKDIAVSLNAYTLVQLNDFHTDFEIPFKDQTDGGVILAEYTVKNDADEDAYFMPSLDVTVTYDGVEVYHTNNRNLIPLDVQLDTKLGHDSKYLIPAGEAITGYVAYPFGKVQLDTVVDLGTIDVLVPTAHAKEDDFGSSFGERGRFTLSVNAAGDESVASNSGFYQDRVTFEKMGDKKMLKEKSDIGDTQELGDNTVTLDGYQFTEFTPNADEAPSFSSFANGMVLLTTKFEIENKGFENIETYGTNSKLTVNDGSQYMLNEGMLLKLGNREVIEPGNKGEFLQIFVLDQEQYEKIWKDKSFEIEVGPLKNEDSKDISKGKRITFTLPD